MEAPKRLSIRAYAEHRKKQELTGKSKTSVERALRTRRIFRTCDEHDRCPLECSAGGIDPAVADADWEIYTQTERRPGTGMKSDRSVDERNADQILKINKARLARLDYEERVGNLVDKSEVQRSVLRKSRALRDAMLRLPARLKNLLAAELDPKRIERLLEEEIRKSLDQAQQVE